MLHMKYQLHKNNFNIDISFQFCVQKDPKKQKAPEEKLTVSREEIVKGVVIKGIVCNPKNIQKSTSNASLNPFEKRTAPSPPIDSVTKPKTKKGSQI